MKKLVEFLVSLPSQPGLRFRQWRERRLLKKLVSIRFADLPKGDRKKIEGLYELRHFIDDLQRNL